MKTIAIESITPPVRHLATGPAKVRRTRALWERLKREPLVQFMGLGALIFATAHIVQHGRTTADRQIVIDAQLKSRIVEVNRAQSGITPGKQQLDRLVEQYIDDEVMYREAMRLGLDRDDEIVRRRLIQKVQFLQRDLAAAPRPNESVLREYYTDHPEIFSSPPIVTFEQRYFSADRGGWSEAEVRARHALDHAQWVETASPGPADDPFPFQIPAKDLTRVEAGRLFGDTPIVDALFSLPEQQWSGPVRSAYGWHLVRVAKRSPPGAPPFAQVRDRVESAYLQEQGNAAEGRELAALRARYDVVRPAEDPR